VSQQYAYKFLGPGRMPCHGGRGAWPEPGAWTPVLAGLVPCKRGYHVCGPRQLVEWIGPELWRVEWRGESVDDGDKLVVAEARLVERITAWDERTARLFACDCAERVVHLTGPDDRCVAAIAVARRFARGEATDRDRTAAVDAASAAARASRTAAVRAAALAAAWAAGEATASATAGDAASAAARATTTAARDAALIAATAAAGDAATAALIATTAAAAGDAERAWQTDRLLDLLGLSDLGTGA
jgi:hypothetical protein